MSVLDDRYLRAAPNRVVRELRASEAARARGIATPVVKCGAWYTHGFFRRFDIATLYIPESRDLSDVIFDAAFAPAAVARAATLIRDMLRAGLIHQDLNLKNILVTKDRAFVLDLDRCYVVERVSAAQAEAMRARLFRSLAKWQRRTGKVVAPDLAASLTEAFRV
jgi:tRNA A-37 threonylcarbamoyl transferase component Bud32